VLLFLDQRTESLTACFGNAMLAASYDTTT